MYPIIQREKSVFVKCNYKEREKYFEGYLQKDFHSSREKEVTIASVSFQPKSFLEKDAIEIGLSIGENGNCLFQIDKGENLMRNY